jgi:phospholipid/cholesterol/gamma-HCH transport system substrate-binding protein
MLALVAVIVLGVYYIGVDVLGIDLGAQPYTVKVMLAQAGGVYAAADVTYRGVDVGHVSSLHLVPNGVQVDIAIKHGVRIPADTSANVRQLSALGEQYLDLVPANADGPYLHNGSVIAAARTTIPVPIGTALTDLGQLVKSINPTDIQTIETILDQGFSGTNVDLRNIVVNGQALANALVNAAPGTLELVEAGNTVLKTAQATNGDFNTFTTQLEGLSGTFAAANANVKSLFDNGVAAVNGLNPLLTSDNSSIEGLVSNLGAAGSVSLAYAPAVQALFAVLPVVSDDLASVGSIGANNQVTINGVLGLNTENTVCPYVLGADQALPTQSTSATAPPLNNTCSISAPDLLQRGAEHAPVVP